MAADNASIIATGEPATVDPAKQWTLSEFVGRSKTVARRTVSVVLFIVVTIIGVLSLIFALVVCFAVPEPGGPVILWVGLGTALVLEFGLFFLCDVLVARIRREFHCPNCQKNFAGHARPDFVIATGRCSHCLAQVIRDVPRVDATADFRPGDSAAAPAFA